MAMYYSLKGRSTRGLDLASSLDDLKKALAFFEQTQDTLGIMYIHRNLWKLYLSVNKRTKTNFVKAKYHYDQVAYLLKQTVSPSTKTPSIIYFHERLVLIQDKGRFYPYPIAEKKKDFEELIRLVNENAPLYFNRRATYMQYSLFLLEIGKPQEALPNALLALKYASNQSEYRKINIYSRIGDLYAVLKNWQQAEAYYLKAIKAENPKIPAKKEEIIESYNKLIQLYFRFKRIDQIQPLLHKRDSLRSEYEKGLRLAQMFELENKQEVEKQKLMVKNLELKSQVEQSQQKTLRVALIGTLLFTSFIVFLLLKLRRINVQLQVLQTGRDKFYTLIVHDLRSHLNSLADLGSLLHHLIKQGRQQDIENVGGQIENMGQRITLLLNNLFDWGTNQYYTRNNAPLTMIDIVPIVQQVYDYYLPFAGMKGVGLSLSLPPTLIVQTNTARFELAVRNLLDNALKHTNKEGLITIGSEALTTDPQYRGILAITDTGEGIVPSQLSYLQQVFSGKIKSEVGVNGLGLGTVLIQEFARKTKALLQIESELGKGTTVTIKFR
jgi:signal transduction histidine kinase